MSEVVHIDLLRLYCRVCSKRSLTRMAGEGGRFRTTPKANPYIKKILLYLHDVDISHESESLYPNKVCGLCVMRCHELIQKVETARDQDDQALLLDMARKFPLADFWAHSSVGCSICEDPAYDGHAVDEHPKNETDISVVKMSSSKSRRKPVLGKSIDVLKVSSSSSHSGKLNPKTERQFVTSLPRDREFRADVIKDFMMLSAFASVTRRLQSSAGIKFLLGKPYNKPDKSLQRTEVVKSSLKIVDSLTVEQRTTAIIAAIIDTVQDGKLSILAAVGIKVDIMHPKMAPLLQKIRSAPIKSSNSNGDYEYTPLSALGVRSSSRKRKRTNYDDETYEYEDSPADFVSPAPVAVPPEIKKEKKVIRLALTKNISNSPSRLEVQKLFEKHRKNKKMFLGLPKNKQLQADVLRDLLSLDWPNANFTSLEIQGITFDYHSGSYHLQDDDLNYYSKKRKEFQLKCEGRLRHLTSDKFCSVMTAQIFELISPDDTLTLNHVGILLDPTNINVPPFYRIQWILKELLLTPEPTTPLANDLCDYLYKTSQLEAQGFPKNTLDLANSLPEFKMKMLPQISIQRLKPTKAQVAKAKKKPPAKKAPKKPAKKHYNRPLGPGSRGPYKKRNKLVDSFNFDDDDDDDYSPTGVKMPKKKGKMDPLTFADSTSEHATVADIEYENADEDAEQDPLMMLAEEDEDDTMINHEGVDEITVESNLDSLLETSMEIEPIARINPKVEVRDTDEEESVNDIGNAVDLSEHNELNNHREATIDEDNFIEGRDKETHDVGDKTNDHRETKDPTEQNEENTEISKDNGTVRKDDALEEVSIDKNTIEDDEVTDDNNGSEEVSIDENVIERDEVIENEEETELKDDDKVAEEVSIDENVIEQDEVIENEEETELEDDDKVSIDENVIEQDEVIENEEETELEDDDKVSIDENVIEQDEVIENEEETELKDDDKVADAVKSVKNVNNDENELVALKSDGINPSH